MSTQPTQAHLDKATCWIVKRPLNVSHQIDSLAQLIADSALETELAAAKAECERLMNQRDNLLKPLRARAEDRADAADEKVERLTSENEKLTIERDALANGSAIEIARLRADLERFTGHGLLDCHAICDQRDAAITRAAHAELKLEKMATALADCISTFRSDDKTTIITAERQEAWRAALLSYKPDHTFT